MRAQELPGGEIEAAAPVSSPRGRVGAARALQLVGVDDRPLAGTFSDPAWETRRGGLFFTRDFGGTRNIWRAFPDPRDTSRYPRWRALPVTQFQAPLFAFGARPLEGDRAILMVSNAASSQLPAQATFFDLLSPTVRALTGEPDGVLQVAPAPDGSSFAFSSLTRRTSSRAQRGGISASIWTQNLGERPAPASPVLLGVWRPAWQGRATLLVEGVGNQQISRLNRGTAGFRDGVATPFVEGSSITSSRDGSTLVLVGKAAIGAPLYLLSGDGSGLTALSSTEGALSPALSGDGRWLAFTAPLGSGAERGLWVLPLQSVSVQSAPAPETAPISLSAPPIAPPALEPLPVAPFSPDAPPSPPPIAVVRPVAAKTRGAAPVAQIRAVQNAPRGAVAIWGIASGADASATLEIGQGALPRRWEAREIALPTTPNAPLLVWNPPASARGVWNFRLTVSGPGGAAQSLFTAQLPLAPSIPSPGAPFGSMPVGGPLPSAPLPDLPAPPPTFPPPLPPLSPAPPVRENPSSVPPGFPIQPAPPPSVPRRSPAPPPRGFEPLEGRDAASFNVSNTLAQMKAGQRVTVTFWALNKGNRAWDTGMAPGGMVRLVTRWIRFDNGNRNGWTYQTMKTPVGPGTRTRWDFDLVAPRQPGRYKLIYALQRVPQGWAPPAYNAAQETWPGDFEAIAFAVVVKP